MVKKKVFITGVGGLLGSTLARRLLVKGNYHVAGCDTFIGGIRSNVPDISFFEFFLYRLFFSNASCINLYLVGCKVLNEQS